MATGPVDAVVVFFMLSFLDANDNWPSLDVTQMRAACILSNYLGELIVNAASLEQGRYIYNHNKGSERTFTNSLRFVFN